MNRSLADATDTVLRGLNAIAWLAPLLLRLFFGYFWLETGWAKLHNLEGFAERFAGWGIPFPMLSAALSAGTDLVGGALMMLGLFTRLAMVPMIVNMAVAYLVVVRHSVSGLDGFVESDEPLYVLVFFWLLVAGPGAASLDSFVRRWLRADSKRATATPDAGTPASLPAAAQV